MVEKNSVKFERTWRRRSRHGGVWGNKSMASRVKCLEPQARRRKKASLRQMKAAMASYKGLYLAPSEADDAY